MSKKKMTSIGGQAVIEGIMMKGPEKVVVAVRKPDGEIVLDENKNKSMGFVKKIPLLRGVFAFVDSMVTGVKALMFSANFYEEDGTAKVNENRTSKKENKTSKKNDKKTKKDSKKQDKKVKEKNSEEMPGWMMALTVAMSVCFSVGLFIAAPNLIASLIVPNVEGNDNAVIYNIVESVVKIIIFLTYLLLVSKMKDIQRVFEYHGAEHKTIFCYESGEELKVENVKKFQRFHPRCGTSFLLFVIIISIIVFSLVGRLESKLINMLVRIAFLPIIAGISYEIIRFAGKHTDNKWISWLNKPGMWLQRLTTREPDEKQIEVAIVALKAVLPQDEDADNW